MNRAEPETVTRLLQQVQAGDRSAVDALFRLVYDALHARAQQQRRRRQSDPTLNTTALVHEAYLKMVDQTQADWESRAHFLSVAATAMRHILTDYARRRRAEKRGGNLQRVPFDEMQLDGPSFALTEDLADRIVILNDALEKLAAASEREAKIVEYRFFGGMNNREIARALGISVATVKRDWTLARAWLFREMKEDLAPGL